MMTSEQADIKFSKEIVAIVRKFHGTTDPTPIYEITFQKNVKAGEKLELDPTSSPLLI